MLEFLHTLYLISIKKTTQEMCILNFVNEVTEAQTDYMILSSQPSVTGSTFNLSDS